MTSSDAPFAFGQDQVMRFIGQRLPPSAELAPKMLGMAMYLQLRTAEGNLRFENR